MTSDDRPPELPESVLAILRQPEVLADPPADLEARAWAAIRQEGAGTEEGIGQSTEAVDELSRHATGARPVARGCRCSPRRRPWR